jgi:hypothetical protein
MSTPIKNWPVLERIKWVAGRPLVPVEDLIAEKPERRKIVSKGI